MIRRDQFIDIQDYKRKKLNRRQCSVGLGIYYGTVRKYWDMSLREYDEMVEGKRKTRGRGMKAAVYDKEIRELLEEAPQRTTAQVLDRVKEMAGRDKLEVSDRTFYAYVRWVRREMFPEGGARSPREYEPVPECAPGEQCQMDFGERWLEKYTGGRVKIHFAVFVLSHSRYKFATFQDKPFQAEDVVNAIQAAYRYFGGRARELVIDQDSTMVSDGNFGDIQYSRVFTEYLEKTGQKLTTRVCRAADPESKGKIESAVKFVAGNFLENRKYLSVKRLNEDGLRWLARAGNGKVHSTTKKVPAKVFEETERHHLLPEPEYDFLARTDIIERILSKDNTFAYRGNRYQVPFGTYCEKVREIRGYARKDSLAVFTPGGEHIHTYRIEPGRGKLVQVPESLRRQRKNYAEEEDRIVQALGSDPVATRFLSAAREDKPRHIGDQLRAMLPYLEDWSQRRREVLGAMERCLELGEPSAPFLIKMLNPGGAAAAPAPPGGPSAPKRGLEAYARIAGPGKEADGEHTED